MGWNNLTVIEVTARVSNHNSPQDDIDMALFEELKERLEGIASQDRYKPIMPMF